MMRPTRRGVLVVAVAAAALVAVVTLRPRRDETAELPQRSSNRAERTRGDATSGVPVVDLGLGRLEGAREALPETNRNPFRFRPAPAPPPRDTAPRPAPRPEVVAPPPVAAGPPPPPPIPVKFFGLVVLKGERVAAFSDTRGNTFYGREGDIIEGRYRVLRIGTESVELAYLDGRGRQTIRLTGQ